MPDTLTEIGKGTFALCSDLEEINIPDSVKRIRNGAFDINAFTEIVIPDSVTSLERKAFDQCFRLQKVTIGASVKDLYNNAFDDARSLTELTIMNPDCEIEGITTYDFCDFTIRGYKGSTAEKYAEEHLLNFEAIDSDYKKDYSLSRELPLSGHLGDGYWSAKQSGEDIFFEIISHDEIPAAATWEKFKDKLNVGRISVYGPVPDGAFMDFDKLTVAHISSGNSIGANAFKNCTSLKAVCIPETVGKIDDTAFIGCSPDLVIEGYSGTYAEQFAKENNIEFNSIGSLVIGDANCNGEVELSDAVLIMQSIANPDKYKLTYQGKNNADCSGNGDGVTGKDALAIQKYMLKLVDKLPTE